MEIKDFHYKTWQMVEVFVAKLIQRKFELLFAYATKNPTLCQVSGFKLKFNLILNSRFNLSFGKNV